MGTVLGMPISGFLCQIWGWESVFYFFGENNIFIVLMYAFSALTLLVGRRSGL